MARVLQVRIELKNRLLRTQTLTHSSIIVGRNPGADVYLDNPGISWEHCVIVREDDGRYYVKDLKSANGTLLNERPIRKERVRDGDAIRVGKFVLKIRFQHAATQTLPPETDPSGTTQKVILPVAETYALSETEVMRVRQGILKAAQAKRNPPPAQAPAVRRTPAPRPRSNRRARPEEIETRDVQAPNQDFFQTPSWPLLLLIGAFAILMGFILGLLVR